MSRLEDYVSEAVCFKINGHVLCYDILDILWKGLDIIRVEDNWSKY